MDGVNEKQIYLHKFNISNEHCLDLEFLDIDRQKARDSLLLIVHLYIFF